jgi:hypothetical protein
MGGPQIIGFKVRVVSQYLGFQRGYICKRGCDALVVGWRGNPWSGATAPTMNDSSTCTT